MGLGALGLARPPDAVAAGQLVRLEDSDPHWLDDATVAYVHDEVRRLGGELAGGRSLHAVEFATTGRRPERLLATLGPFDTRPAWAPDRRRFALARAADAPLPVSERIALVPADVVVGTVDPASSGPAQERVVVEGLAVIPQDELAWSPDGARIAFLGAAGKPARADDVHLFVVDVAIRRRGAGERIRGP